jgi:hypothetical protein
LITSPAFRKLGTDVIVLSRDILADAADEVAKNAREVSFVGAWRSRYPLTHFPPPVAIPPQAAAKARPSEKERQNGVDFKKMEKKGKDTVYHAKTGKLQAEGREKVDSVVGDVKKVKYALSTTSSPRLTV